MPMLTSNAKRFMPVPAARSSARPPSRPQVLVPTYTLPALILLLFLSLATVTSFAAEGPNLILNPDFSLGADAQGVPVNWVSFARSPEADFSLTDERATVGTHSLKLADTVASTSVGLRSHQVAAMPGTRYVTEVDVFVESGTAMLYLDFLDARGQRVDAKTATTSTAGSWRTLSIEADAPPGTAYITLILYSSIPNIGTLYFDNVRLYAVP